MSLLTDKAIEKITKECEGKDYLIPFEEYLTNICTNDKVANKILNPEKTLEGAFKKMRDIAKNRAINNCAYIPNDEGFQIIEEYYEITFEDKGNRTAEVIDIMELL